MKLYLLRHGRTLWNEEGRLQGRTDVPLSDEGRCSALDVSLKHYTEPSVQQIYSDYQVGR